MFCYVCLSKVCVRLGTKNTWLGFGKYHVCLQVIPNILSETSGKFPSMFVPTKPGTFKPKQTRTELVLCLNLNQSLTTASPEDNIENVTKRNVKFNTFVVFKETFINSKDWTGFINSQSGFSNVILVHHNSNRTSISLSHRYRPHRLIPLVPLFIYLFL